MPVKIAKVKCLFTKIATTVLNMPFFGHKFFSVTDGSQELENFPVY